METMPTDFKTPRGFSCEPELTLPVPRPIPSFVYEGSYSRTRRRTLIVAIGVGLGLASLTHTPFDWAGLVIAAIGAIGLTLHAFHVGRYELIRKGMPVPVQIVSIVKAPLASHHGQVISYCFVVTIIMKEPETGAVLGFHVRSDGFFVDDKDKYTTTLRDGDFVTGIYLPQKFGKTFTLYGFTGLNPSVNFVRRRSETWTSILMTLVKVVVLVGFVGGLPWNLYCTLRYMPLGDSSWWPSIIPAGIGCLSLGSLASALIFRFKVKEEKARLERNAKAEIEDGIVELGSGPSRAMIIFGGAFFGLCFGLFFLLTYFGNAWALNASLDRSPPQQVVVPVIRAERIIHKKILPELKMYFKLPPDDKEESISMHVRDRNIPVPPEIVIDLRRGYFGWPWVSDFHPKYK